MKIVSTSKKVSPYGGKEHLECVTEDGSIYTCNMDGSVFVKIAPSFKELSDKLKKQLND